jgi:hypothetical protein
MKLPRDSASPVIKSSASPAAAANVPTSQTWTNWRPLAHTVRRWRAAAGPLPPQGRSTLHTTWANSRASARPCFARSRGPGLRGAGSPGGGVSPAFPHSRRPPPKRRALRSAALRSAFSSSATDTARYGVIRCGQLHRAMNLFAAPARAAGGEVSGMGAVGDRRAAPLLRSRL